MTLTLRCRTCDGQGDDGGELGVKCPVCKGACVTPTEITIRVLDGGLFPAWIPQIVVQRATQAGGSVRVDPLTDDEARSAFAVWRAA